MDYYYRSSLAYDLTLFEESEADNVSEMQEESSGEKGGNTNGSNNKDNNHKRDRNTKAKKGGKRGNRRRSKLARIIFGVVCGLLMAFVVVSIIHGQVQLTELNQEIADAKARLAEQQSIYTQLEM